MVKLSTGQVSAKRLPKARFCKVLKAWMARRTGEALCQRMSKSQLTLVEAAVKTSRRRQDAIATRNIADTEIKA
jgi:hypothetical protein